MIQERLPYHQQNVQNVNNLPLLRVREVEALVLRSRVYIIYVMEEQLTFNIKSKDL